MAVHRLDPALRSPHRKAMNLQLIILNQALKDRRLRIKLEIYASELVMDRHIYECKNIRLILFN